MNINLTRHPCRRLAYSWKEQNVCQRSLTSVSVWRWRGRVSYLSAISSSPLWNRACPRGSRDQRGIRCFLEMGIRRRGNGTTAWSPTPRGVPRTSPGRGATGGVADAGGARVGGRPVLDGHGLVLSEWEMISNWESVMLWPSRSERAK